MLGLALKPGGFFVQDPWKNRPKARFFPLNSRELFQALRLPNGLGRSETGVSEEVRY
jgi:hypothetical protein